MQFFVLVSWQLATPNWLPAGIGSGLEGTEACRWALLPGNQLSQCGPTIQGRLIGGGGSKMCLLSAGHCLPGLVCAVAGGAAQGWHHLCCHGESPTLGCTSTSALARAWRVGACVPKRAISPSWSAHHPCAVIARCTS
jgi:hypothetical protein